MNYALLSTIWLSLLSSSLLVNVFENAEPLFGVFFARFLSELNARKKEPEGLLWLKPLFLRKPLDQNWQTLACPDQLAAAHR